MSEKAVFTFTPYLPALDKFWQAYASETFLADVPRPKPQRKAKAAQKCRFCGRNGLETKFKHKAHLIPRLLGNEHLLSDFECDDCNLKFSAWENDLANYLGIFRTVRGGTGNAKLPTFKSSDKLVTARPGTFMGVPGSILIERAGLDNDAFTIRDEEGIAEIKVAKNPYIPINVYKALLKMALSVLDQDQVGHYKPLFQLLDGQMPDALLDPALVVHHTMPSGHSLVHPHCFMFRKRETQDRQFTHQFYLRYQHHVFCVPIPFHTADIELGLFEGEQLTLRWCPPLLFKPPQDSDERCRTQYEELQSHEVVREEEVMVMQMTPGAISNSVALDIQNGRPAPAVFDPKEVIKIHLVPRGSQIQFPEQDESTGNK
ncbi:HNH endonuclease [Hymenobacter guriensis]|uniref:HNH endonuclease 5 domain-containing protein n=1 Tax=Hymenobacter guriensis TaxID=2793065 RepID=A0ABS0L4F3_9BACT|nr:HNH endonuclease [Hymenobacter guriensis]MBG8555001.1 hypothetical protein [Hymenobacter guriensis]